jgi:hypothetical protein
MKPTERIISYQKPSLGYWVIPTEKGDLHLAQELNPAMTQEELAGFTSPEGFRARSMKDYMNVFSAVYDLRNTGNDARNAMLFVRKAIRAALPNTLTRIRYNPKGKDTIIHGYKTSEEEKIRVDFVGNDGDITKVLSAEQSLALTGRKPEEVAEIINYINESPAFAWRLHSKPQSIDERVARFDADSGRAYLDCVRGPDDSDSSLGVRLVVLPKGAVAKK